MPPRKKGAPRVYWNQRTQRWHVHKIVGGIVHDDRYPSEFLARSAAGLKGGHKSPSYRPEEKA